MSETLSRWSVEKVVSLAPDPASVSAARKLSLGSGWSETGVNEAAVWGCCKGSGSAPYRTIVNLSGPAYRCSCPSRKFPCKHSLGLLLRWAQGLIEPGEPADFAQAWLESRLARADRDASRATAEAPAPDPVAQAKRAEARAAKVTSGLVELDRWLLDQIRRGLTGLQGGGYQAFDAIASRMVNAQAPGLASWLRRLPGVLAGDDWPARLLEEFALLRLLIHAHARLSEFDALDPALAATVRGQIGYPVPKESVLAEPGLRDDWAVWAVHDTALDNLTQRTARLFGTRSARHAVVLSFAAAGQPLDDTLIPGGVVSGDLHFYPGARASRALVGERAPEQSAPFLAPTGGDARAALESVARAVAADPWTRSVASFIVGQPVRQGERWLLVDDGGAELPLIGHEHWTWVACAGGVAQPTLLDWTPNGWLPLSVLVAGRVVVL